MAAIGLFVLSGALFPLLLAADGILDDGDRSKLRLLALPVYAASLGLLALRPGRLMAVLACNLPLVLLVVLPFLSMAWSLSPGTTLRRAIALALSMSVALLLAARLSPRDQMRVIGTVLGTATGLSILMAGAMPHLSFMPGESALRGIFVHKNVLGWAAAYTILFGIAARRDAERGMRRTGLVLLAIGWIGVILSTSVTSLFAAVVALSMGVAADAVVRRRGLERFVLDLGLLIAGAVVLMLLFVALLPLLEALGKDATLTGRVPLWQLVDAEIAQRALLGHGFGAFWSDVNTDAWRIWETIGWQAPHAHNGYRDILLGLGLTGLALFAYVVVRAWREAFALYSAAPREGTLWPLLVIGTSLVLNLSESTLLMQNDVFWLILSAAIATVARERIVLRAAMRRRAAAVPAV
ncbi:O-antigen ligase family protein [Roseivivax isoporae]|uniref:O-antigen ligase family protein n=1 Tax=Roseivivax isoporae TaxID=591206 RepID=UPI0004B58797|nr:O-antigen ligase family protein [Roseivivax isoporae]